MLIVTFCFTIVGWLLIVYGIRTSNYIKKERFVSGKTIRRYEAVKTFSVSFWIVTIVMMLITLLSL